MYPLGYPLGNPLRYPPGYPHGYPPGDLPRYTAGYPLGYDTRGPLGIPWGIPRGMPGVCPGVSPPGIPRGIPWGTPGVSRGDTPGDTLGDIPGKFLERCWDDAGTLVGCCWGARVLLARCWRGPTCPCSPSMDKFPQTTIKTIPGGYPRGVSAGSPRLPLGDPQGRRPPLEIMLYMTPRLPPQQTPFNPLYWRMWCPLGCPLGVLQGVPWGLPWGVPPWGSPRDSPGGDKLSSFIASHTEPKRNVSGASGALLGRCRGGLTCPCSPSWIRSRQNLLRPCECLAAV